MGFVGGGGNIATCPTPIFCVLHCKHQIFYVFSLSNFLCLTEASVSGCGPRRPGPRRPVPAVCRILCSNVGAWQGTIVK